MNLEKLYKMQEELDAHILLNHYKRTGKGISKEELLDDTILALLVEVGELANTTRCFKHWSIKGMMEKEVILDELADVWHFYLSIGNQIGYKWHCRKETDYNPLWNGDINGSLTYIFHIIYIETSFIANDPYNKGMNKYAYQKIGINIARLAKALGFTDEEVEQAYLKKHEENYRRQREGY